MSHEVLCVLLAGGAGERLHPLTRNRAKPAVPFGGVYRIIDFTLSNCMNSGLRCIQVLVQYKSNSLVRHIRQTWDIMRPDYGEFVDIIPPQMRVNNSWYQGTADAIYQNLYSIDQSGFEEVLVLSGDHIYKMDYMQMVNFHREVEADLTIATIEVPLAHGSRFGVLETTHERRVVGFEEKPESPRPLPGSSTRCCASMGIYVFGRSVLREAVLRDAEQRSSHDFGRDIIPGILDERRVYAYPFVDLNNKATPYWRDVGTLDSYWEANMDLVAVDPVFNLYDRGWPIRTYQPQLPPAKFVFDNFSEDRVGTALDSIVSPGCIISGGTVRRSVLSSSVRINSYSHVEDSIIMHGASIGRHARLRRCIVEKDVAIPEGVAIGYDPEEDMRRFPTSANGIVVVERDVAERVFTSLS